MKTVLILEDEPLIAMDLEMALEDCGIDAVVATDTSVALDRIGAVTIDGAILDVNLGGGHTCEPVALELKRRAIPFILNTGDLDRTGELLRKFEVPVVAKPTAAETVIQRLLDTVA